MATTRVLVVGVYHLAGSPDMVQAGVGDREALGHEMEEIADRLSRFAPTRVAVEVVKEQDEPLHEAYRAYRDGDAELGESEVQQLGFRLANKLEHEQVHAVDWMGDVDQRGVGEVIAWAEEHDPAVHKRIMEYYVPTITEFERDESVLAKLRAINEKSRVAIEHEMYMTIGRIGVNSCYIGIDWLRWWYQRNLIISANVVELGAGTCASELVENTVDESNEERIILFIGGAHVHLVKQFLRESGKVKVEEAGEWLQ